MSIRISNLRLALDEPEAELGTRVVRLLGIAPEAVKRWRILRKSLDGRDKNLLRFVYSIEMELEEDEMRLARIAQRPPLLAADARALLAVPLAGATDT